MRLSLLLLAEKNKIIVIIITKKKIVEMMSFYTNMAMSADLDFPLCITLFIHLYVV